MGIIGARSEICAKVAARKYARILQRLGYDVHFKNFHITNVIAQLDLGFEVNLNGLGYELPDARYNSELFSGLVYKMEKDHELSHAITALIFNSGKLIFTGGKVSMKSKSLYRESMTVYTPSA